MGQRCSCQRLLPKCNLGDAHYVGSIVEHPESRKKKMPDNQVIDYYGIHQPPEEMQCYTDFTVYRRSMLWKSMIFLFAFATEVVNALPEQSADWLEACRTGIFVLLVIDYMLCAWAKGFVLAIATGWTPRASEDFVPHHHFSIQFQNMFFGVMVFFGACVMASLPLPEDKHMRSAFAMSIDLFLVIHHGLVVYVGRT